MAEKIKTFGVGIEDSALAFSTPGVTPSAWLQDAAGAVWGFIKKGVKSAIELGKKMFEGGKELLAAIGRGDWGIFIDWAKNDPLGFLAGGAAVAVGGWFIAGATGLTALAAGGISSLWATLGSIKIGGVAIALALPSIQQAIVGGTTTIVNLDWMQSDKAIEESLKSTYNAFLNNVGESTGRLLAGMLLGGGRSNPKLTLNITATAAIIIQAEQEGSDIEEEMIEELSALANAFKRYWTALAGKTGMLELRKYARGNIRTGIPQIDAKIKNWGLIEGQSFTIATHLEEATEKLKTENEAAGNLVEGLFSGFGDGWNDFLIMT
ncbi:MAG TPA: hypothetical protein V6D43_11395 [Candidatus Sericytochromatia bacterium]